jgi:hypothetical protein
MIFQNGTRVRLTRDYKELRKGREGTVTALDADTQTYTVTLTYGASLGPQQIPAEFLEAVEG